MPEVRGQGPRGHYVTHLRVLVAIPVGWMISSDFVARMTQFATHPKMQVAILYEKSATRLDFSLSKIIAMAKRFNPDVTLRFDADCMPYQDIDTVVGLARSDFQSGFDLVYSPTRAATMHVMALPHDPAVCPKCAKGEHLPELGKCSASFFGALGYSAMSPRLIEAWGPHVVEYGPAPYTPDHRQVRYVCTRWAGISDYPMAGPDWDRKMDLSEVDPDLNTHVPMYVVNPPDNSEDADLCFDVRSNGFKIGCDPRLRGTHLKRGGLPNWGSAEGDRAQYEELVKQGRVAEGAKA